MDSDNFQLSEKMNFIIPTKKTFFKKTKLLSKYSTEEKNKHVICRPGRSVLEKTVPEVLSTALGLRPPAVIKTSGTVFPNTELPAGK